MFGLFNKNVEKVIKYRCKICGNKFNTKDGAARCASKGNRRQFKIGTIFKMYSYDNIIFAIIKQYPDKAGNYEGHYTHYSTWACRDSVVGDNCDGENYCGLDGWTKIYAPNKEIPAHKRMVEALEKAGIEPVDYVEEK